MEKLHNDWVTVRAGGNIVDVLMTRGMLESEGIECFVQNEALGSIPGPGDPCSELRLMVRAIDEERALQILADMAEAQKHPNEVHFLCDPSDQSRELKDLDNLVLDLEAFTIFSIGRGMARSAIEKQLGEPAAYGEEIVELSYAELGTVFYFDSQDRLSGFLAVIDRHPDFPDLDSFPGFWDPGSKLKPPSLKDMKRRFGKPVGRERSDGIEEISWEVEDGVFTAQFDDSGNLFAVAMDFGE